MLSKVRSHFLLALVFFLLTLCQQYSFFALKGFPIVFLSGLKYVGIFAFFLAITFSKGDKIRYFLLSLILILNIAQMAHLSYFGTQVLPSEIWLLFAEFHEMGGTLKEDIGHILIPFIFTIVPLLVGWFAHKRIKNLWGFRFIEVLFALYLVYNPIRTYVTGNTWGRQPSTRELTGMNVYLSISYFTGRILPKKLKGISGADGTNSSLALEINKGLPSQWDKIIFILGESLTPHHMQLFGYERATTPFLENLKNDPNFFHKVGLSGGVSTDISVAFFLNLGFGPAGAVKAAKGNHCLFRLAKDKGFTTHFLSIQSSEQLRYIAPYLCSSYLDSYQSLEDIAPATLDHQAARDRDLLKGLPALLAREQKDFIMLHQRGSHSPWNLRSSGESIKFSDTTLDQRINDYDNSVVEFDFFWKELYEKLNASKKKVLVIYISDHGESVGEDGRWGHGFLEPRSFEIPIIMAAFNQPLPKITASLPKFMSQYNLALTLTQELGFQTNQSPEKHPEDFVVFGNDIDGFAGKADIKYGNDAYTFKFSPDF